MINIKPSYEKVSPNFGNSILVKQNVKNHNSKRAFWHFHPEIELVYVNKGKGKRHIGSHLSYFNNSQLILIGANLPHNGFTDRLTAQGKETLVQFRPEVYGTDFLALPELKSIQQLFGRAKKGLLFKSDTKKRIGPKIESLANKDSFGQLISLLEILDDLAKAEDYEILNADGFAFETEPQDNLKIDVIFNFVNTNFKEQISLSEVADLASMTVPGFCRYFKKATGKTFTQMVNEYRVVHATKLLSESESSITDICFASGFNNFSHFNKLFKAFTGKTALQYRKEMRRMIQ
ncbi:MAG: helix-turn-helix transcriptional regulator [Flavobacteriaceae bacterium]|nr:AraC family transcriptional regulator [Bacteroidia bacterium]MBT8288327.1 AraC family transcriptional regulator [Bacteroidia bacterium]NNF75097.1 helix-turn-helix transcriptional regulator [Flavobacteriaceae bacterium]NNK73823.1 helix-turn-helix transcriptional regulator [Flavobacteriaceae bacterium]